MSSTFIESVGVFVPTGRLDRTKIAEAWGLPAAAGRRSVAALDEDAITMAVEACRAALEASAFSPEDVGLLFFATTTPPYKDKLASAIVAAALDLRESVRTLDVASGLRAGMNAVNAADDAVRSGSAKAALVVASDCRVQAPESAAEQAAGDAAVALVLAGTGSIARIEGWVSAHDDLTGRWRGEADRIPREFEPRLEIARGYGRQLPNTCRRALKEWGLAGGDIIRAVMHGPDVRTSLRAAAAAGLDRRTVVPTLLDDVGDTGAAAPLLGLVKAFEETSAGDRILAAAYGDGVDTALLTRADRSLGGTLARALAVAKEVPSYESYMAARRLVARAGGGDDLEVSPVAYWRNRNAILRRHGGRCGACGTVQFPSAPACTECGRRGTLEPARLTDRGTLFTFTHDHLVRGRYVERPLTRCVIDLDGGGRLYTTMTDCEPEEVAVGMPVELAFRSRGFSGGFENYGWKCRPAEV